MGSREPVVILEGDRLFDDPAGDRGAGTRRRDRAQVFEVFPGFGERARPAANARVEPTGARVAAGVDEVAFALPEVVAAVASAQARDDFDIRAGGLSPVGIAQRKAHQHLLSFILGVAAPLFNGEGGAGEHPTREDYVRPPKLLARWAAAESA